MVSQQITGQQMAGRSVAGRWVASRFVAATHATIEGVLPSLNLVHLSWLPGHRDSPNVEWAKDGGHQGDGHWGVGHQDE